MKLHLLSVLSLISFFVSAQVVDPTFTPLITKSAVVNKVVEQSDNKLIVVGDFIASGATRIANIARLNADGSLDNTFSAGTGFSTATPGKAVNLFDVLILSSGKIMVAGYFESYNGQNISTIARLNSDGSLDNTFNPGTGANSTISRMALQSDGKIILRGRFTNYNGTDRFGLARINADGSLDNAFDVKIENRSGSSSGTAKACVTLQPDQKILVGGEFTHVNNTAQNNIVRINADGTIDGTFTGTTNGEVNDIDVMASGKIFIVGRFTTASGAAHNQVARLNSDGTNDAAFLNNTSYFTAGNSVSSAVVQTDGKIIVGGNFQAPKKRIVRLNTNGSEDTSFAVGTNGLASETLSAPDVNSLLLTGPETHVIAAGSFSKYYDISRFGLVKILTSNGNILGTFDPMLGSPGMVNAVQEQTSKVIIGGDFQMINGQPANFIARLSSNGTLDGTFTSGTGFNGVVNTIVMQQQGANAGKLVVGGSSLTLYNTQAIKSIVRLTANGVFDNTFTASTFGSSNEVLSIALLPTDELIVGGMFSSYGALTQDNLIRISANGVGDNSYNTTNTLSQPVRQIARRTTDGKLILLSGGQVFLHDVNGNPDPAFVRPTGISLYAVGLQPDNKLLVGGSFSSIGSGATKNLARLNDNGTTDPTYKINLGTENYVSVIKPFYDYMLLGAAYFYANTPGNRFGLVDMKGRNVPNSVDVMGSINTFGDGTGYLYIGGSITKVSGTAVTGLARISLSGNTIATPANLAATKERGQVNLSWTDTNTNENGFEIWRSEGDNAHYTSIGYSAANVFTFSDNTVAGETQYFYKINAFNFSGPSAYSTEIPVISSPDVPAAVSDLLATELSSTRVKLTWNDNSGNETSMKVFRNGQLLKELAANTIQFEDTNADPGTYYYYSIKPSNSLGDGPSGPTATITTSDLTKGSWSDKNSAAALARVSAVSFTIGAKAYMGTGSNASLTKLKDFYEYDPQGDTWTAKTDFAGSARVGAVGFAVGGYGYIGLGNDGTGSFKRDFYKYDPTSNAWTRVADFPEDPVSGQGRSSSSSFVIGDYAYVGLGNTGAQNSTEFWRYDPAADKWEKMTDFPGTGRFGAVGFAINGKGYFGLGGSLSKLSDMWEYNPTTNSWTQKGNLFSSGRAGSAVFTSYGRAYIVGGNVSPDIFTESLVKEVYEFNAASGGWRNLPAFTGTERSSAIAFSVDDKGYVGFGSNGSTYFSDLKMYTSGVPLIPKNPDQFTATLTDDTTIKLTWADNSDNETKFVLEGYHGAPYNYVAIAILPANTTEYIHSSLDAGVTYTYRLRASNDNGHSDYTPKVSKFTMLPPQAPTRLKVDEVSTAIKISWTDNSTNESNFTIEYSTDGINYYYSANVNADVNTYTYNFFLEAGSSNYFRVRAYNNGGFSEYSEVLKVKTLPTAPFTSAAEVASTFVVQHWMDYSSNEDGFHLYRSADNGQTYQLIFTSEPDITTYKDTGLTPLTKYIYRIASFNESGDSFASYNIEVTTVTNAPPANFKATLVANQFIQLTWDAGSNLSAQQYEIQRSVDGGEFQSITSQYFYSPQYNDYNVVKGKTYVYKIRAITALETSEFSGIVTVKFEDAVTGLEDIISGLKIYPNPVLDKLTITTDAGDGVVILINSLGQSIQQSTIRSHTVLDLSSLSSGNYYLKIVIGDKAATEKIVKK